jgi:hypothetical protein
MPNDCRLPWSACDRAASAGASSAARMSLPRAAGRVLRWSGTPELASAGFRPAIGLTRLRTFLRRRSYRRLPAAGPAGVTARARPGAALNQAGSAPVVNRYRAAGEPCRT